MTDQQRLVGSHWLADHLSPHVWIRMIDLPNSVVVLADVHAYFLMSTEPGIAHWTDLTTVQEQWLIVND